MQIRRADFLAGATTAKKQNLHTVQRQILLLVNLLNIFQVRKEKENRSTGFRNSNRIAEELILQEVSTIADESFLLQIDRLQLFPLSPVGASYPLTI